MDLVHSQYFAKCILANLIMQPIRVFRVATSLALSNFNFPHEKKGPKGKTARRSLDKKGRLSTKLPYQSCGCLFSHTGRWCLLFAALVVRAVPSTLIDCVKTKFSGNPTREDQHLHNSASTRLLPKKSALHSAMLPSDDSGIGVINGPNNEFCFCTNLATGTRVLAIVSLVIRCILLTM